MRRRLLRRRPAARIPIVLCVDVEPDAREPGLEETWDGVEMTLARAKATRERLRRATGSPAQINWFVRADPQVAHVAGDPAWIYRNYAEQFAGLAGAGDEVGLHVHAWRWLDDRWVADHADRAWVSRCVALGLRSHAEATGGPPPSYRGGDHFLSVDVLSQLREAGVATDVTVEPRSPAVVALGEGEHATGSLPDFSRAPEDPYRLARGEMLEPGSDGPAMIPLTAGASGTLLPWLEPDEFASGLEARCARAAPAHLAFAIRSDLGRWDNAWERMLANLEHAARRVGGARFVTAGELAKSISPIPATQ